MVEGAFARGRGKRADGTLHKDTVAGARKMMTSEQLAAFDVSKEPAAVRKMYGDTPFGRGCLAARRLIEVGVRCVEVTLSGWDTHANNHTQHKKQLEILDPAFAALIKDLRERKLLDKTLVIWAGEFGRTPTVNPAGGRDHWPIGFSVALAGGGIRGGTVVGATDPDGKADPKRPGDGRQPARDGSDGGRHRPDQAEPDADRADGEAGRGPTGRGAAGGPRVGERRRVSDPKGERRRVSDPMVFKYDTIGSLTRRRSPGDKLTGPVPAHPASPPRMKDAALVCLLVLAVTSLVLVVLYIRYRNTPAARWKARVRAAGRRSGGPTAGGPGGSWPRSTRTRKTAELRQEFLDRQLEEVAVEELAKYPGIGPVTVSRLREAGLTTVAACVRGRLSAVPGIGPCASPT